LSRSRATFYGNIGANFWVRYEIHFCGFRGAAAICNMRASFHDIGEDCDSGRLGSVRLLQAHVAQTPFPKAFVAVVIVVSGMHIGSLRERNGHRCRIHARFDATGTPHNVWRNRSR
jgi:hypothetical protein